MISDPLPFKIRFSPVFPHVSASPHGAAYIHISLAVWGFALFSLRSKALHIHPSLLRVLFPPLPGTLLNYTDSKTRTLVRHINNKKEMVQIK